MVSTPILQIYQGTDDALDVTLTKPDGTPEDAIDSLPMRWLAKLRATDDDSAAVLSKTTANGGIVVTDAPNGKASIYISEADTAALTIPVALVDSIMLYCGLKTYEVDSHKILCPHRLEILRAPVNTTTAP